MRRCFLDRLRLHTALPLCGLGGMLLAASPGDPVPDTRAFPTTGILPKEEIRALQFLKDHPTYDGRGVVVAIFDTGVDPGAPGLQSTPDGRPKIVDMVDATGSGDVDTSTVRTVEAGTLRGLSGRALTPGAQWRNPDGKYHLGLKRAYELFPQELIDRLQRRHREVWDVSQRALETRVQRELAAWIAAHPKPTEAESKDREDLELRLEQLRALQKSWEDPGPVYDCVVFHDGNRWRAVIDTDEDGDLGEEALLANFREERQYATFGKEDLLNFAVNLYDDGKVLSIVADSGMHGTHVAGIVAAHFPDHPELNGIAPGAQIVSVKIGDTRLDGMETATGFTRGLAAVRRSGCDIINLSYGELTTLPNRGRVPRLVSEIVHEDGVIFVSSAGNEGPALTTVGAPGGTVSALIGVGAYVSPAMMETAYSMRHAGPETQYTFSSRGPTEDGAWGVSISAPGGAISPVPNWTLQRSQLANGTSMASPNAAGGIALLLSGLKAEGIRYTPISIRRAVENSARTIPDLDVFTQGRGLLQVDQAFALCQTLGATASETPRLDVSLPRRHGARGLYLREPAEARTVLETVVQVTPVFAKNADNRSKVALERRFRLEANAPWIQCPAHLLLTHGGRSFEVRVDPTQLEPGVHAGEVVGLDTATPQDGPAFRVPIVVIRPQSVSAEDGFAWRESFSLKTARLERRFFEVPAGATGAELTLKTGALETPRRLVVQAVQLQPRNDLEYQRYLNLTAHTTESHHFQVAPGGTLELCLGPVWSSLGDVEIEATLEFRGLTVTRPPAVLDAAARVALVELAAPLHPTRLAPRASLHTRRITLLPSQAELRPLSAERDTLPEGRQLTELILTYPLALGDPATATPRFPSLNARLYEGEFESQLMMLFDAAKRLVAVDDGWAPGPMKIGRGDHVLRFHLRHDQADQLDKLKTLPLLLDLELANAIPLNAYATPDAALVRGDPLDDLPLNRGQSLAFWLAAPDPDQFPKNAVPGDLLLGNLRVEPGDGVPEFPVCCTVPPPAPPTKAPKAAEEDLSLADRLAEERRDFRVNQLDRLTGPEHQAAFDALAQELLADYPDHLAIRVKRLHRLDDDQRHLRLRSVVAAADEILQRVDTTALAAWAGTRPNPDDPAARRESKTMERQKEALVDTLHRKARALAWMDLPDDPPGEGATDAATPAATNPEPPLDTETVAREFEATFTELRRWVDTTQDTYALLHLRREWRQGRLGEVLRLLQPRIEKSPTDRKLHNKRIQVLEELGWSAWVEHERQWNRIRFPSTYPGF